MLFYVFNEACLTFVFGAEEQKSRSCCWVVGGKREAADRAAKIYYSYRQPRTHIPTNTPTLAHDFDQINIAPGSAASEERTEQQPSKFPVGDENS